VDTIKDKLIEELFKRLSGYFMVFVECSAEAVSVFMSKNLKAEMQEKEFIFRERTFIDIFSMLSLCRFTFICTLVGILFMYWVPDLVNKVVVWCMEGHYIRPEDFLRTNVMCNLVVMICLVSFAHLLIMLDGVRISSSQDSRLYKVARAGRASHYINAITFLADYSYLFTQKQIWYTYFYMILVVVVVIHIISTYAASNNILFQGTAYRDGRFMERYSLREGVVCIKHLDDSTTLLRLFDSKIIIGSEGDIISLNPMKIFKKENIKYIDVCGQCRVEYDSFKNKWVKKE